MVTAERLSGAMAEQVLRFAKALSRARHGDASGIHQARVASRRIREILPLIDTWSLATGGGPQRRRRRNKDVRRIAAALGSVRELDVTAALLSAAALRHGWNSGVVAEVAALVESDRASRLSDLEEALEAVGPRSLLHDLRRIASVRAPHAAVLQTTMKTRRQGRASAFADTLRALGTLYVPDRLHAVRLAAKKLRYSLEAQRAVQRSAVAGDIRTLTSVQEALGQLHDLQILQDRLRGASRQAHRAEFRRMNADIERECRALHARVIPRVQAWLKLADRLAEA